MVNGYQLPMGMRSDSGTVEMVGAEVNGVRNKQRRMMRAHVRRTLDRSQMIWTCCGLTAGM